MENSPYFIGNREGFSPQIARLIGMMNYARETTLQAVQGLSIEELDLLPDPNGNSIGMLLEHFAAVEIGYAAHTFDNNEDWDAALGERWQAGGDLGALGREKIHGNPLSYYFDNLRIIREKTLAEFAKRNDTWLEEPIPFWGSTGNRYFAWFHVFEDEINHRGQIRLIAKHIPRLQNRGMLGLNPVAANADGTGMKLEGVSENRPAALAGLQVGDVILEMDGLNTSTMPFFEIPFANSVGVTSIFKVQRGSDILEFSVTRVAPH
jgi:uncharacterized damage-inducible protein DinB